VGAAPFYKTERGLILMGAKWLGVIARESEEEKIQVK